MAVRELVCIIDPIHPHGAERIASMHEVIGPEDPQASEASVIVIRTSPLGPERFGRMTRLKAIVKHGAGVDNIAIPAATAQGVMVANTPGGNNSTAVAEGAVSLMLGLLRRTRDMDALVRENRWDERWAIRLGDLTGARVGLIGYGRIARAVAAICGKGFGCDVTAYDPLVSPAAMRAEGVEPGGLAAVLASDIVSIHVPLTETTRNLIDTVELGMMKPHAVLVNCSRGGIVNEAALAEALRSGQIAAAGIDVFAQEPPGPDNSLYSLPNCLLSPHVAGVTEAGMKGMALHVAAVIDTISRGEIPDTLLNPEVLP